MLSRLARQSFGRNSNNLIRYYSTQNKAGGKKPTNPISNTQQPQQKTETEILNFGENKEFKDAIKKSRQQYSEILKKITESSDQAKGKVSVSAPVVKPKIHIASASGKIAHALFSTASQMRSVELVSKDVELLSKCFEKIPNLRTTIEGDIDVNEKITALDLLSSSVTLSPLGGFFLYYMTYEHKFNIIVQTLKDFKRLVASLSTELAVRLTVASEQSQKEKEELENRVKSFFPSDTIFKFTFVVDPSIKAGYIIESPLLNHNASLNHAIEVVEQEERTVFADFVSDLKKAAKNGTEYWNSKEFRDKYLAFDEVAYEAQLKKKNTTN